MHTLVIDTSYGSTVGIVGYEPIIETDTRTHVEHVQVNIAQACAQANINAHEIDTIVVGTGPAPFTGLRVGIVTAKAIAQVSGATLLGQDDITCQNILMQAAHSRDPHLQTYPQLAGLTPPQENEQYLTLAVNDARRKQLYFTLLMQQASNEDNPATIIDMDIDYPNNIAQRVNEAVQQLTQKHPHTQYIIDIAGRGAQQYATAWENISNKGTIVNMSLLDCGTYGITQFAANAIKDQDTHSNPQALEPLYLRRPDVSVPNPLKHVLNHEGITRNE